MTTQPHQRPNDHPHGFRIEDDPELLKRYASDASGLRGAPALGVAWPRSVAEIQEIVAYAREHNVPLLPVSSVGSRTRGDTVMPEPHLIVDMSRWRKVRRADDRHGVALVEAGVDFPELRRHLAHRGLRPLLPLRPRPGKSALAAYLEREPTIHPGRQWDLSDPLLCIEVVFGTGELFRTGSAAGPGDLEEQWRVGDAQTNPMGPGQSDLMRIVQGAQGTIGVVTWCSIRVAPVPHEEELHVVAAAELEPLVELAYRLLRRRHVEILFLVNGAALSALLADDHATWLRLQAECTDRWYLVYTLVEARWFPAERRRYASREISAWQRELALPPAHLPGGRTTAGLHQRILDPPGAEVSGPGWRATGLSGVRELPFLTTLDRAEKILTTAFEQATDRRIPTDTPIYIQPLLGGRSCHVDISLPFPLDDEDRRHDTQQLADTLARVLYGAGAFFSRPYGPLAKIAFSESSTAWIVPKTRQIFDPNGIFARGNLVVPTE